MRFDNIIGPQAERLGEQGAAAAAAREPECLSRGLARPIGWGAQYSRALEPADQAGLDCSAAAKSVLTN
jgi:hypothetical protein